MSLTLSTFNVHHPRGRNLQKLGAFLHSYAPDIVGLQEISKKSLRALAKTLGMHFVWSQSAWLGNGLLSRFPIQDPHTWTLRSKDQSVEARSAIRAHISTTLGEICVVATHLDHIDEDVRREQWSGVDACPRNVDFVLGDFNALHLPDYDARTLSNIARVRQQGRWEAPRGDLMREVQASGWSITPFGSNTSRFDTRIDYVLTNARWRCTHQAFPNTMDFSDHCAVVVRVTRGDPSPSIF